MQKHHKDHWIRNEHPRQAPDVFIDVESPGCVVVTSHSMLKCLNGIISFLLGYVYILVFWTTPFVPKYNMLWLFACGLHMDVYLDVINV